jgi:Ca2+-binding RTX toxin-like protein
MATFTTLIANPNDLLGNSEGGPGKYLFENFVPPIELVHESISAPLQTSTQARLILAIYQKLFQYEDPGIYAKIIGTGLTYANGVDLPVGGQVSSIEFGAYVMVGGGLFNPPPSFQSLGTTHRLVFDTPIDAADLFANSFDLTTLFYGGADSMVGASSGADLLNGYGGNDTLDGQGGDDTLLGGVAQDVLTGGSGDDSLLGEAGSDQLRPATGEDSAFGGDGNDTILVTDTGGNGFQPEADLLDGGTGTDMLRISSATSSAVYLTGATITGIETLRVEAGYPWLTPAQFAAFTRVELGSAAGTLTTIGIKGNGTVNLNLPDMPLLTSAGLTVLLATDGTPGTAFTVHGRDLGTYVNDSVFGSMGNDNIRGYGGNDSLDGSVGNDTLAGGSGNDQLRGGDDDDTVWGSTGADTLEGGSGIDTLTGGDAADRFRFTNQDLGYQGQTDRITDFARAQGDKIDLSGIDANAALAGDQAFSAPTVLLGGASPPPAGSLRYEVKRDHVLLSLYTDSDAAADFFIRVNGTGWTPAASDFFL